MREDQLPRVYGRFEVKDGPNGTYVLLNTGRPVRTYGAGQLRTACAYAQLLHSSDERIAEKAENRRHLLRGEFWKIKRW